MAPVTPSRASERGAALFIVVMVITLLTAIGVFAVHATSLAQTASGYSRRAAAAMYVAEFGLVTVTGDVAGKETEYMKWATDRDATTNLPKEDCRENVGVVDPNAATCHKAMFDDAVNMVPASVGADATGALFGILSRDQSVMGNLEVQMHDLSNATEPQPGMPQPTPGAPSAQTRQAAFTVTGSVHPTTSLATANQCTPEIATATERISLRAVVVFTTPP